MRRFFLQAVLLTLVVALSANAARAGDAGLDFFETKIRPVLSKHCYACHSASAKANNKLKGGLQLDRRDAALRGGDSGAVIVAGKPESSSLLAALRYDDLKMPPSGPLPKHVVKDFEEWVRLGAPWPRDKVAQTPAADKRKDYPYWRSHHWAWRPIQDRPAPFLTGDHWSNGAIDRFILTRLRAAELTPSPPAERRVLYRRLHVGLLGLPPSYEDTKAFVEDRRPDAYERSVDRLLASPAYGEKWGRHWLDIARYADNGGFNSQTKELYTDFPYAYSYRDYVVRSFNRDLPYDRFIVEQLAADKLPAQDDNRALAALGFLTLGDKSFGTSTADRVDDCIDTVTRGLMGITVSCARCHDHKYDPIPTEDYYSLFSVFRSSNIDVAHRLHTREKSAGLPVLFADKQERVEYQKAVQRAGAALDEAARKYYAQGAAHLRDRIGDYLLAASRRPGNRSGLNAVIVSRWRAFLAKERKNSDSPFSAWPAFLALPRKADPATFGETLKTLIARTADNTAAKLVLDELSRKPPGSLKDVAEAYGRVLRKAEREKAKLDKKLRGPLLRVFSAKEAPLALSRDQVLRLPVHDGVQRVSRLRKKLQAAKYDPPRAVALRDKSTRRKGRVYLRGNPRKPGKSVPRQFLALLSPHRKPFQSGSGRLELAKAIVAPSNPLTARVIVNRVWQHHFGAGLVSSASDFGVRSDPPTHPQLLDHLAARLMAEGWSLKKLHRRILLSQTYRQASLDRPEASRRDEENRWLWRMNRRRLMFESIRDALLSASGEIDRAIGGRPAPTWESRRRTIYGYINRYRMPAGYLTFDFPSTMRTSPGRAETLVPQQSLFLMNAPFVQQRAKDLIKRLPTSRVSRGAKVILIYRRALGRDPRSDELKAALEYVAQAGVSVHSGRLDAWERLAHALFLTNEFIFVD